MSATEEAIIEFLKGKATVAWTNPENPHPYLLSFAGPDFREAGIDYHSILADERLKAFVERTASENGYRVVKHPTQAAKIGLVPWGIDFEFDETDRPNSAPRTQTKTGGGHGSTLLDFLDKLSDLPDSDLDKIVIPMRVLVKLARKK